jgi:hypothetical protein
MICPTTGKTLSCIIFEIQKGADPNANIETMSTITDNLSNKLASLSSK